MTGTDKTEIEQSIQMEQKASVAQQTERYMPSWVIILAVLAAGVVYLFQRGTPVDQAMSNAVTVLAVGVVLASYGVWFLWRGPAGAGLKRLVLWGSVIGLVSFFSLIRITGVTGQLMFDWDWRWEGLADENLTGVNAEIKTGQVDLKSLGDRLDYPGFLGKDRHPYVQADWLAEPNADNVIELWRRDIGAGWSGFAAVAGFGVTMEQRGPDEIVSCYHLESGEIRWAHTREFRHSTILGGIGPRATPTIYKGDVYALSAGGILLCLAGKTGEQKWEQNVLAHVNSSVEEDSSVVSWGRSTSPLIVDNLVVVPAGGPKGGPFVSLLAFNRSDGELVWKGGREQVSFSSPTLMTINGNRQVVVVNESSVAGHDVKTGKQVWKQPWAGSSTSSACTSQPYLVGENSVFISKGYGQGAMLFAVDNTKTSVIWENPAVARTKYTNAALVDGRIYSLSDGILECADLGTGDRIWKKGRFNHGQLLVVGELILVQSEEGGLHFIKPLERGFDTVFQLEALKDRCWATMTLYNDKLILRNSEQVVCYQLPVKR
ncbi:MAG: hypothetical protein CMJ82_16450 [Planctomycetaceae bacterium]|nr:hypothetical protein [Planctomycetaceae bacterium]